ncbi:hypothetical protein OAR89_02850 [Pelagibacteraceae bacterium]|nr:hypothetical protein [Pelagibacteraceae bacterium]
MKIYKFIIFILIVFLKTGNVLSDNNIFNVNNIELQKKGKTTNDELSDQAIKKGFKQLMEKILLREEYKKISQLNHSQIKELVSFYQVENKTEDNNVGSKISYNISFDKDKLHDLFYKKGISYSEIIDKELFLLPILKKDNQFFIYNQNFFYDKWNEVYSDELLEFELPLENIEIIQKINSNKNNLLNLELRSLFEEYSGKNLALVLIEDNNLDEEKVYLKTKILGKNILKNIVVKKNNLNKIDFYKKIIIDVKKEIINIVKSQNLIDVRTPSFLNAHLSVNDKNSLVEFNKRLKKIDLIENIYVQELNNKNVFLKIKYLGKLEKIIKQLNDQKIILKLIGDQWSLKII